MNNIFIDNRNTTSIQITMSSAITAPIELPPTRPYDAVKFEDTDDDMHMYVGSCNMVMNLFEPLVDYSHLDKTDDCYWEDYERETLRQLPELKELGDYASWCSDLCNFLDTVAHGWDRTGNLQWIREVKHTVKTIIATRRLGTCDKAIISKTGNFELSEAAIALLKAKYGFEGTNFNNRRNLQALIEVVETLGDYASAVPGDFVVVPLEPKSRYVVAFKDGTETLEQYHKTYDVESGKWKEPEGIDISTRH
jgi:hypothetical protein